MDAAANGDPVTLAAAMRHFWWVHDKAERPLPIRLSELQAMCRRLVPVLAPPAAPPTSPPEAAQRPVESPAPPQRRPRPPAAAMQPPLIPTYPLEPPPRQGRAAATTAVTQARCSYQTPRTAPVVTQDRRAVDVTRWPVPRELLTISGHSRAGLRYVVPTSADELRRWGLVLRNCLGDYASAVASGESWLIGVERDDQLIGCVEVRPSDRRVRQALGPRNLALTPDTTERTFAALRVCGVIR